MTARRTWIFLVMALVFALFALTDSGALSRNNMERSLQAAVSADSSAALTLVGFDNPTLVISNVNKKYFAVGSITNHYRYPIVLTVTITPDFSRITNKNYWLGVNIGGVVQEFIESAHQPAQISLTLQPAQVAPIQVALTGNQAREVYLYFGFSAIGSDGIVSVQIIDDPQTPRRMTLK